MHQRGKPASKLASPELVHNSAVGQIAGGQQPATPESRLPNPNPARVKERSPTLASVAGPSAERTSSREDSCIRSRPPRRSGSLPTARTMNTNDWSQHSHFAALDWACDHHDVVIVNRTGALVAEFRFAHTAAGWAEFTEKMKPYPGAPLALETSSGPAVDQLLQRGLDPPPRQSQGRRTLPRTQSAQRHQDRSHRRLEPGRRPAHRRPRLAPTPAPGRSHRHPARPLPR